MKVLVVEDNAVTGDALAELLRLDGFETEWAANAAAALTKLQVYPADAVVADYLLPDADGVELCRRVHADGRTRRLPVVIITAVAGADFNGLVSRASATGGPVKVIRKPFEVSDLEEVLRKLTLEWGGPC